MLWNFMTSLIIYVGHFAQIRSIVIMLNEIDITLFMLVLHWNIPWVDLPYSVFIFNWYICEKLRNCIILLYINSWCTMLYINFIWIWISRSRKLNSQLENAIQEAMLELDRMTEQQQSAAAGTASATVSNEPTGRLRRNSHRWPLSLSFVTSSILLSHTILISDSPYPGMLPSSAIALPLVWSGTTFA